MSVAGTLRNLMMRAIRVSVFGGPEVLKLEENVAVPTPANGQVLLRVHAAGVNPVETYIRQGTYARKPELPYCPGGDAAGVIEAVGPDITRFKKGDRVFTTKQWSGAYAEFMVAEAKGVLPLSDKLTFEQGASIGVPYYTAYRALVLRAKGRPGETVLVHGASGAVGIASVQIAKSMGLKVLGTAGTSQGLELVTKNGADAVFNHREEGYTQKIMDFTQGEGVDIVLEMLSNVNLQKDLEMMRQNGRVVIIGCRGTIEINPRLTMAKETSIMGMALGSSNEADWQEMHSALEAGQKVGWLQPHVGKVYALEEAITAHRDVINNSGTLGKLVLKM